MMVRIVPLPLSISNAYLLIGDRPVFVDAGVPGEEQKLLDLARHRAF
jgi:hydroxyacylglutathione hydrolase